MVPIIPVHYSHPLTLITSKAPFRLTFIAPIKHCHSPALTMSPLGVSLGLRAASSATNIPNYAPAFLSFHFIWAYCVLASRTLKQWYGIDPQESTRQDLDKYGNDAVKSGKITQKQLEMLRCNEAAHANSVENYAFLLAQLGSLVLLELIEELLIVRGWCLRWRGWRMGLC
jgi:hypothetical protein